MGSEDDSVQKSRAKQWRRFIVVARRRPIVWFLVGSLLVGFSVFVGLWSFRHMQCYSREAGVHWHPASIIDLPRPCPSVASLYETVQQSGQQHPKPRVCLTSLTDRRSQSMWQRWLRCRDFDGVADLTLPNLQAYAKRHGYKFFDASSLIDTSRPPAWSKIKAVQYLLAQQHQEEFSCDWVFWVDADIVVMNSSVAIESFLPAHDTDIDLLVTMDRRLTANSGAWLIRNSPWSQDFLKSWWNMRTWVREPGLSLSGDNAAFGHLMEKELSHQPTSSRVKMVPRCAFNSFAVFVKDGSSTGNEQNQEWYLSENYYHRGDFMAHASGVDQKKNCVEMLLQRAV